MDARGPPIKQRRIIRPHSTRKASSNEDDNLGSLDTPGAGPSRSRSISPPPRRAVNESREPRPRTKALDAEQGPAAAPAPTPRKRISRRSHLAPTRHAHPPLLPCRSVYSYTRLNHIEEGTYGVVFRARCNETNQIFALKKLKLDEEKNGFPITSLREVMALMSCGEHENVVGIREIVVGETLNQSVVCLTRMLRRKGELTIEDIHRYAVHRA